MPNSYLAEQLRVAAYENLKKQKNTPMHLKNDSKGFHFLVKLQARMAGKSKNTKNVLNYNLSLSH